MYSTKRRIAAVLIAIMMFAVTLPAFAVNALDYNEHDAAKLRAFLELTSNLGIKNGNAISGDAYDPDDPSTWRGCTWNDEGRLTNIGFQESFAVGNLDLEGCDALETVNCYLCKLTGINITGCPLITILEIDDNRITSIDVTGCPLLSILWIGKNRLTSLDLSGNPLLYRLNCSSNRLTALDVTCCPQLTYLDCGDNSIAALDLSCSALLEELSCKNNKLTELDLSACVHLERLRTLGNQLRVLDMSVMNGGNEFVLRAAGNGYVGTKLTQDSSGYHVYAYAAPETGSGFYGWYEGSELLTESDSYLCIFDSAAKTYTARFDGAAHRLNISYVFEDGSQAAAPYSTELEEGAAYSVLSPMVAGYCPDMIYVEGTIGGGDENVIVTYSLIPEDIMLGDVNNDGVLDSRDALLLLRYTVGLVPLTYHLVCAGDVDHNGVLNASDALRLLRMALGLVS